MRKLSVAMILHFRNGLRQLRPIANPRRAFWCFIASTFLFLFVTEYQASADYIPPGQVVIRTKAYQPGQTHFASGVYEYDVNWQGIPVGRAQITVRNSNYMGTDCYTVTATATSASVVRWFYTLNHLSESIFRTANFAPMRFYSKQTENSKTKSREVNFREGGDISSKLWKEPNPGPEEEINFHSENTTFDPISAAFLARTLPVTEGEDLSFDVFNGKHRFLIGLHVGEKQQIELEDRQVYAYPVTPTVKKLTDSDGEKRLRSATIWISADESKDVLKLESKVLIGSVRAELVSFTPANQVPDGSVRASLKLPVTQSQVPNQKD